MLAVDDFHLSVRDPHLRPLDPQRDLLAVADLIELTFAPHMDPDGKEYLRQMRRVANDVQLLRWATSLVDHATMSLGGLVWEEDGRLVGNLSLIPSWAHGKRVYLIANVAVHPDYRRRGIGRALTQAAVEQARQRGAASARLQVRADNPGAHKLYDQLGFVEVARRTTWVSRPGILHAIPGTGTMATPVYPSDWSLQKQWLQQVYPSTVDWNLPVSLARMRPSVWNTFMRFLSGEPFLNWAARKQGKLAGVLTWQPSRMSSDWLWLAADPELEEDVIRTLLPVARKQCPPNRSLGLNYPAGRAAGGLSAAGLVETHTLVWMDYPL